MSTWRVSSSCSFWEDSKFSLRRRLLYFKKVPIKRQFNFLFFHLPLQLSMETFLCADCEWPLKIWSYTPNPNFLDNSDESSGWGQTTLPEHNRRELPPDTFYKFHKKIVLVYNRRTKRSERGWPLPSLFLRRGRRKKCEEFWYVNYNGCLGPPGCRPGWSRSTRVLGQLVSRGVPAETTNPFRFSKSFFSINISWLGI